MSVKASSKYQGPFAVGEEESSGSLVNKVGADKDGTDGGDSDKDDIDGRAAAPPEETPAPPTAASECAT